MNDPPDVEAGGEPSNTPEKVGVDLVTSLQTPGTRTVVAPLDKRKEMDERLSQRLAPSRAALVVVDVQNDYCHPDGAFGRRGVDLGSVRAAVANVHQLIAAARQARIPVVFLRNWHQPWTTSEAWRARKIGAGDVCQAGTWGAELYEVKPLLDEPVVDKQRYSGFVGTALDTFLHTVRRDRLVICGIATNVCVESTARHAVFLDYFVLVVADAAATADGQNVHEASLANIRRHFGMVATTDEVLAAWSGENAAA